MIHVDTFSSLPDLTQAQQADRQLVMRLLHKAGRFSCFEASDNPTIAATMTALCKMQIVETDTENFGYPWTGFKLTRAGYRFAFGCDEMPALKEPK